VEVLAPRRMGPGFRWLLASSWVSNLGDGLSLAAGPLLVASLTHDPVLVALAALLQWLPPLLFALVAGALTDRLDRRALVVVVDLLRAGVLALLGLVVAGGVVSIWLVLLAMFLLGTAEVFADNASATLLPMLVDRDDLALANSRLMTGFITVNQLVGPPVGAALFALGHALPFAVQAATAAGGALLVSRVRLAPHGRDGAAGTHLGHEVLEAVRWVARHAAVRTLVLTVTVFNVTFGAAWSILVLYAKVHLGMGSVAFGLLTTFSAVGGLLGTASYGWITRHVSLGDLMRIGLVVETLTHLALALTTSAVVAMVIFLLFGAHAFIWGTTSVTVRQRAVPTGLQGRVGSVNLVGTYGGLVVGSAVGGVVARHGGVTAPFWFAFVGSAVFLVLIWRQLTHIAHADEQEPGSP
jgi:predicted MFS family arabinose efflux permease